MKRARPFVAGLLTAAALGFAGLASPPAGAASYLRSGWWNAANTGTVAPPAPPDVPDGGLSIQGGPSPTSPGAFAAVAFDLGDNETPNTLSLTIAGRPSPNLAVQACVIPSGDCSSGGNQPASSEPEYDCEHIQPLAGTVTPDGLITFNLSGLSTSGRLALAILPVGTTDRVATQPPDSGSLTTKTATPPSDSGSTASSDTSPAYSPDASAAPADSGIASSGTVPDSGSASYRPSTGSSFEPAAPLSMTPPPPAAGPPAAPEAAAAPAESAPRAAPRVDPVRRIGSTHDLATKVGGLMALGLLFAAMAAYVRGFGLMGGRIAD